MIHWLEYILLAAILIGGLYLTLLTLPGLWVMFVATLVYALLTKFSYAGTKTLIAVFVLAGIAEVIDLVAGGAGAKKAGATRAGLVGAILGSIAGGIFLSIPLPIIGTIIGICIGTFAGAIIGELCFGQQLLKSLRVGAGAAWGRLLGIITKLFFGCVILAIVLIAAMPPIHLWHHKSAGAAPARTTLPASTMPARK